MDIGDLECEKAVFEWRYSPAYLLWDKSGVLWTEAITKWPKLKLKRAEPGTTAFALEDAYEIAVTAERASVLGYYPKADLVDFAEKVEYFLSSTNRCLDVQAFKRLGLRLLFFKKFPDERAASAAVFGVKRINLPGDGPFFGFEGSFMTPECAIKWGGKALAATVRLKVETRKIEVGPVLGIREVPVIDKEEHGVLYDVDYATQGTVTPGQFRARDWINQGLHVIRRDSKKFLGE